MSVGLSKAKADIDAQAGQAALQLREAFLAVQRLNAYLVTVVDADLIALGYTAGEVAVLKSGAADLDKVRTVYEGTATQSSAYDARTFAKQFIGPR